MPQVVSSMFKINVSGTVAVTARIDAPAESAPGTPSLVLAHGANNDLDHPLLAYLANKLAGTGRILVVRFNFPYVERGATSPDSRKVLEATFKRVWSHIMNEQPTREAPIFVGGKSLGGRVAAELVSHGPEGDGLRASGLVVLGYPLHAPGHTDRLRLEPLRRIDIPSLFFAGSNDPLCDPKLLRPVLADLLHPGTLCVVEGGDHSLKRSRRPGVQPQDSYEEVAEQVADFMARTVT